MYFKNQLHLPGEHQLLLPGLVGSIEAILTVPEQICSSSVAFLGHPHSLQGGTMNNKVVTTMARAFRDLGVPCLRFNFRGVGSSEGAYDEGVGESEDLLCLVKIWQEEQAFVHCVFAGFSFGSYVAYRAASYHNSPLITIAPPVHHYDYTELNPVPNPWLIIQGDEDEVVPSRLVMNFSSQIHPVPRLIHYAGTGHFFHGNLVELKTSLTDTLSAWIQPL